MQEIDNPIEILKTRYEQIEKLIKDKNFFSHFSGPYHFKDKDIRRTDFPNAYKHGICVFFNRHSEIKYIGMAFIDTIEKKLNELIDKKFIGDKDTEYLRTLAIPDELYYLIPAIESILLKTYNPPLNSEIGLKNYSKKTKEQ